MSPEAVLDFWFSPEASARWFRSTEAFDAEIRQHFLATWEVGRARGLSDWRSEAYGVSAVRARWC